MKHPRLTDSVEKILSLLDQPKDHRNREKVARIIDADFHLGAAVKADQIRDVIGAPSVYDLHDH